MPIVDQSKIEYFSNLCVKEAVDFFFKNWIADILVQFVE
jgi:hypothetical protein